MQRTRLSYPTCFYLYVILDVFSRFVRMRTNKSDFAIEVPVRGVL